MAKILIGGSWAPALKPADLKNHRTLADGAPVRIRDYMRALIKMLEVFWETPESKEAQVPNEHGTHFVTPLAAEEVARIWDHVPYKEELDVMGRAFDEIDAGTQPKLRNAAFHLLWYGRELTQDREPLTLDRRKRAGGRG